jgi:hypothetical protein
MEHPGECNSINAHAGRAPTCIVVYVGAHVSGVHCDFTLSMLGAFSVIDSSIH